MTVAQPAMVALQAEGYAKEEPVWFGSHATMPALVSTSVFVPEARRRLAGGGALRATTGPRPKNSPALEGR